MLLVKVVEEFGIRKPLAVIDDFLRLGAASLLHFLLRGGLRKIIDRFFIFNHCFTLEFDHSFVRTASSGKEAENKTHHQGYQKCYDSFLSSIHQ